ncbi:MAG TPA: HoxN/HupN/NixA family nickel/cobalt transporter [Chthoniobacterales bacterium]
MHPDLLQRASFRSRAAGLLCLLLLVNIVAWTVACATFHRDIVLIGTASLAFTLGLRHAVDADHIAAIDNVTRKLMQDLKKPVAVGFFFALGHSCVVIFASLALFLTASKLEHEWTGLREVGEVFGTCLSASFLVAIAFLNLIIFLNVYRTFKHVQELGVRSTPDLEQTVVHGGLLTRLFKPCFRFMSQSWHMFPLGFLFGLGFETATEISLFGISATAAGRGLTLGSMMVFPMLFAAGMILVDTADGIFMVGAYGWAFVKPVRKLYYNLTITFASILVALLVGGLETIGLFKDRLNLTGGLWDVAGNLNRNFGSLGFIIIGVFVASWAGSFLLYWLRGFDRAE